MTTKLAELTPEALDEIVDRAVARKLGRRRYHPTIDVEWAALKTLGRMFDHSRITAWRIISKVNGSVTADDGPIRRRKLSKRLVVFSVSDYKKAVDRIARENRNRAA